MRRARQTGRDCGGLGEPELRWRLTAKLHAMKAFAEGPCADASRTLPPGRVGALASFGPVCRVAAPEQEGSGQHGNRSPPGSPSHVDRAGRLSASSGAGHRVVPGTSTLALTVVRCSLLITVAVERRLKMLRYRPEVIDGCLAGTGLVLEA